ncbi:MAG: protein arginine kinase [Clostridiaceae bacterium]
MADELILTSRIRLARNFDKTVFPHKMSDEKGKELVKKVEAAFYTEGFNKECYRTVNLWETDRQTQNAYFEKHLISNNMVSNWSKAAVILSADDKLSIMINEEDHIRIQYINPGYNLEGAFIAANEIDDHLEKMLEFAFDEKYGYLTSCPTNVGTGMRASVMIHLPFITMNSKLEGSLYTLSKLGMAIRGIYGEGSKAEGSIYQISNQITLGINEKETIKNLKAVVNTIIALENKERENAYKNYKYEIQDKVSRALGILKSSVLMPSSECIELLSDVRMGIEMGIIRSVKLNTIDCLLREIQPSVMQKTLEKNMTKEEVNLARAKLVKKKIREKGK